MEKKKMLVKKIIAFVLFLALMAPIALKLFHVCDNHEHEYTSTSSKKTQLQKTSSDCDICNFHLVTLNYDIDKYPELLIPIIPYENKALFYSSLLNTYSQTNKQLRAPPYFC